MEEQKTYSAFVGTTLVTSGPVDRVLSELKERFDQDQGTLFLIFEDQTGRQVDFDLRGALEDVLARVRRDRDRKGPGRPRLGVIGREVTLLPRHWEWLEEQPNGVSAALRRLIEQARRNEPDAQRSHRTREAADRFMSAMAGNLPGYEEATRALYARNEERFGEVIREWPPDIQTHVRRMVNGLF